MRVYLPNDSHKPFIFRLLQSGTGQHTKHGQSLHAQNRAVEAHPLHTNPATTATAVTCAASCTVASQLGDAADDVAAAAAAAAALVAGTATDRTARLVAATAGKTARAACDGRFGQPLMSGPLLKRA
jgi:hypothetical protein